MKVYRSFSVTASYIVSASIGVRGAPAPCLRPPACRIFAMSKAPFSDRLSRPTEDELTSVLGATVRYWHDLLGQARAASSNAGGESNTRSRDEMWRYYASIPGWRYVVRRRGRNLLYLAPAEGQFVACFAIRDSELAAAKKSGFTAPMVRLIADAPVAPEGRAVRIMIRSVRDFRIASKILGLKMATD